MTHSIDEFGSVNNEDENQRQSDAITWESDDTSSESDDTPTLEISEEAISPSLNTSTSATNAFVETLCFLIALPNYLTYVMMFAILAAQPIVAGILTSSYQIFIDLVLSPEAVEIVNQVGFGFLIYILALEPFIALASRHIHRSDDKLIRGVESIAHSRTVLMNNLAKVIPALALSKPEEAAASNPAEIIDEEGGQRLNTVAGGYYTVNGDEEEATPLLTPIPPKLHPFAAFLGALLGLPRELAYFWLSPLAACVGIPTTFLQESGQPISVEQQIDMLRGGVAGLLLSTAVVGGKMYATEVSHGNFKGTLADVFSRAINDPLVTLKALAKYNLPGWFGELQEHVRVVASLKSLSWSTKLGAFLGIPGGAVYRMTFFAVAAFGLVPGIAAGYGWFRGLTYTPETTHEIRMAALPVAVLAAMNEISQAVVARTNRHVSSQAGFFGGLFNGSANPYGTAKRLPEPPPYAIIFDNDDDDQEVEAEYRGFN